MTTLPHCGEIPPGVYQAMAITLQNWIREGGCLEITVDKNHVVIPSTHDITLDGATLKIDITPRPGFQIRKASR